MLDTPRRASVTCPGRRPAEDAPEDAPEAEAGAEHRAGPEAEVPVEPPPERTVCLRGLYEGFEAASVLLKRHVGTCGSAGGSSWEVAKSRTNRFELVCSPPACVFVSEAERSGEPVRRAPAGRAFFKLWELLWDLDLADEARPLRFGYVGEAPGSFVEAVVTMRRERAPNHYKSDAHCGMSLVDRGSCVVPAWKIHEPWRSRHNVRLTTGADGTGNLYRRENIDRFLEDCGGECHLVTADGGFDFSCNFDRQEEDMLPLLRAEFCVALRGLAAGGAAVVKVFDAYLRETCLLFEAFASRFREASLVKPVTSRPANSERYLVCRGFIAGAESAALAEAMVAGPGGAPGVLEAAGGSAGRFDLVNLRHFLCQASSIVRTLEQAEAGGAEEGPPPGGRRRSRDGKGNPSRDRDRDRDRARGRAADACGEAPVGCTKSAVRMGNRHVAREAAGAPADERGGQREAAEWWWRRYRLPGAAGRGRQSGSCGAMASLSSPSEATL